MKIIKNVLGLGDSASTSKKEFLSDQHSLSDKEPVFDQFEVNTTTNSYDAENADDAFVHRKTLQN